MINTRQCDFPSCTRSTWEPRRSLCRRHDAARERRGHPAVTRSLSWRTLEPTHAVVLAYLKLHPAPPDVLQKLEEHILGPSADFAIVSRQDWTPKRLTLNRYKLISLMDRWRDPASAKQYGLMGKEVDPRTVLAVLLTVTVYAEDRDWRQGRADELCRALHLLKLRRLPRSLQISKRGRAQKQTMLVPGSARRLLAQVISEHLGGYLLLTARAVITWSKIVRPAANTQVSAQPQVSTQPQPSLPPRFPRPLYRTLADKPALERWARLDSLWRAAGM